MINVGGEGLVAQSALQRPASTSHTTEALADTTTPGAGQAVANTQVCLSGQGDLIWLG